MSNHLVSTTYRRKLGSNLRKSLMAMLADKASDDGSGIYASKQTFADELDCSKRAVIETIKAFVAEGLLHEVGRFQVTNGFTVEYAIDVDALEALPLHGAEQRRQDRKSGNRCIPVTGERGAPVNEVHVTGEPGAPEPLLNQEPPVSSNEDTPPKLKPDHLAEFWNAHAPRLGLSPIKTLSPERRRKALILLKRFELADFTEAIAAIERSPFLRGENGKWRCDFDFFLRPDKFLKMIEGGFDGS